MQSALRLKPTFTDAYNNLASALVQKGLVPAALQCYQAALQINPHLVRVHEPVGVTQGVGDRCDEHVRHCASLSTVECG